MGQTLIQWSLQSGDMANRGVVETIAQESPLFDLLRFMDIGDLFSYEYNQEVALGGFAFRALNEDYGSAAAKEGTDQPMIERTAICGGVVNTDRQLLSRRAGRITRRAKAGARFFMRNFITGDTAAEPKGFDGLRKRIKAGQILYTGNNGGPLTTLLMDKLLSLVIGEDSDKVLVMNSDTRLNFSAIVRAEGATTMGLAEWSGNNKLSAYGGARIVVPGEDETGADILPFTETRGNSDVTSSVFCFRPGQADEEYVQGIARRAEAQGIFEVEPQGVSGTTDKVLVEGRLGIGIFHPRAAARLAGVTNATGL